MFINHVFVVMCKSFHRNVCFYYKQITLNEQEGQRKDYINVVGNPLQYSCRGIKISSD